MDGVDIQRGSPISLIPRRLNFTDSNETSALYYGCINSEVQESPKTPPNHVQNNPPMTPINRKHRFTIPLRFTDHLESPQKDEVYYTTPIKRIRMLQLEEGILDKSQSVVTSKLNENKNSWQSVNELVVPKTKQFSINPYSPAATDLRSKWMNNNNNNDNKLSPSDSWFKDMTNVELSNLEVTRYFKEFKVEDIIGKGDFGEVYKCTNMLEGMPYAIKKTLQKVVGTRRENYARKEVYANAALFSHPNIVAYHSAWNEGKSVFIQLEYCDGGSLDEMIFSKHHNFNDAAIERLLSHLASGLHYMHQSKMVHLDIKPANIMISYSKFLEEGENKIDRDIIYKIGDLGHVAHIDNLNDVEDGDGRYLPKEMLSGKYDSSTIMKVDIFSLGMTAYEAVSGLKLPSDGPEWHFLRDGFVPDIEGFGLSSLLANMIHPNPLNRPNAIDVYKNVTLKATELTEPSTLQFKREYLVSCTKTRSTQSSPMLFRNKRIPIPLSTRHKRRLVGQKSPRYYSF